MHNLKRLLLATCVASSLLILTSATASAERSLEINPTVASNTGRLTFTYSDMARRNRIICEVTLALEYVRVLSKAAAGRLAEPIGNITAATAGNCREGMNNWELTFLVPVGGIPMRYNSFLGDLPRITGLLITALNVGIRIRRLLADCLFNGALPFLMFENGGGQRFNRKGFLANRLLVVEGVECPMSRLEVAGMLAIEPPIEVRLL